MSQTISARAGSTDVAALAARYRSVRAESLALARPLSAEDRSAQSMPDASPAKWHLAHTTWFFETFVLARDTGYAPFDAAFAYLFNSYYEAVGARHARPHRGLLTRPSSQRVDAYRAHVDAAMLRRLHGPMDAQAHALVVLGLSHEEQHQELLLTDVLHLFAQNPLKPAYDAALTPAPAGPLVRADAAFLDFDGGVRRIGTSAPDAFSFDNEGPEHEVLLRPYQLADRAATNAEWSAFIADGGYKESRWWLSEGWATVQAQGWEAPLYWERDGEGGWLQFGFAGLQRLELHAPAAHVSFYEADAFARWRGLRLPTEAEWEAAVGDAPVRGNLLQGGALRPLPAAAGVAGLRQMYGDVWEWTASPYSPYPGFSAAAGAVGEYNGKFMINQMVLRGGSCVTPEGHVRASYRNFFHPHQRWQFSGVRLAADGPPRRRTPPSRTPEPRAPAAPAPAFAREFARDAVEGLSAPRKTLSSKYLYDEAGSALFEAICDLPEYYPTRAELALLRDKAATLAALIPPDAVLVEFGSGASVKTRVILDAAPQISAYAALDISPDALEPACRALSAAYPRLGVFPQVGDFTKPMTLDPGTGSRPRVGFFPGSTIGNFAPEDALAFLAAARTLLGDGALFILGYDLPKDPATLVAAYDDAAGVTAAFNLNLLTRINREVGGDLNVAAFGHRAVWNASESRMEMHIVSRIAQMARIAGRTITFSAGETIHTENSYKYPPQRITALAAASGWRVADCWRTPPPAFAVALLQAV